VTYAPHPLRCSEASQAAIKKWKAEVSKKPIAKRMKAAPSQAPPSKARLKVKPRSCGMSEIELALAKPIGVFKKFRLLDVAASSHRPRTMGVATSRAARVPTFDNLDDDSSPEVCKTPSPKQTIQEHTSLPPLVSSKFLRFSFTLVTAGTDN
jgi:hypothetical protein